VVRQAEVLEVPCLHVRPVINLVLSVVVDEIVVDKVLVNGGRLDKLGVLLDLLLGL
jgi:hypothetical protein